MKQKPALEQCMRWYGPQDVVSLRDIAQAGCTGVVTALHQIPVGEVWTVEAIQERQRLIAAQGLRWSVVESLPVHEEIKMQSGQWRTWIANYQRSLRNLAACDVRVITYNFMPVLDWVRTDVAYQLPDGSEALFFHRADYAVFDLFMLRRPGAEADYTAEELAHYRRHFDAMPDAKRQQLFRNVLLGLPGSDVPFTPEQVLELLDQYGKIDRKQLKAHLIHFLEAVTPVAEEVGCQLAIHPDDPPYSVLGLPRILSTETDVADLMAAVPSPANGLCFCTGSFGARPDNDLPGMIRRWGNRIFFLHLRNTKRDEAGNFFEADHLAGDTDMYAVMEAAVALMRREDRSIPMRPDHGHKMLDDIGKTTYPGYSAIGRLRGLAELRGLEYGIQRQLQNQTL
ncbi:MAG: mannonate dehydratase [Lewinella sp.]|nr:mannonate dehydratase [Lewinella sp.]